MCSHSPFLPPSCPRKSTCSVSVDLHILDISNKWNHTLCGLLCLAAFTEENVFDIKLQFEKHEAAKKKIFQAAAWMQRNIDAISLCPLQA